MKLLAIDGNSIVNRAFYGIKLLTTKDGRYTNGIVGFMNILLRLLGEEKPDAVAVAFDLPAPTFRHKAYDGYKGTRKGMPAELAGQMPLLKELLADLGYRMVTAEGYEADDILGTLAGGGRFVGGRVRHRHRRPGLAAAGLPYHPGAARLHPDGPQRHRQDGRGRRAGKVRRLAPPAHRGQGADGGCERQHPRRRRHRGEDRPCADQHAI